MERGRRLPHILVTAVLVTAFTAMPSANAAVPKCFGEKATIKGNANNNTINGTKRADVIVGLGGDDEINGRGGNDLICGGGGDDVIDGSRGSDKINAGADSFIGDILFGGPGNDRLIGGPGRFDLASFITSSSPVTANLLAGDGVRRGRGHPRDHRRTGRLKFRRRSDG